MQPVNQDVPAALPPPEFRWDPLLQSWFYVINTGVYKNKGIYTFRVTLSDATSIEFRFALK